MRHKKHTRSKYRFLKAGCMGAGLLSISNPTQVTAADIGIFDVHNSASLEGILNPFPDSPLGVHLAVGDIDGDGIGDIIMGPGQGAPEIAVRRDHIKICCLNFSLSEFKAGVGVRVATGDVDGDGRDDIITTPAIGGASPLAYLKYDLVNNKLQAESTVDNVFAGFSGGVSVATGDLDGDGVEDILAARVGGDKPHGFIWKAQPKLAAFEVFGPPLPDGVGGVEIALGDLDRDGLDDILALPADPPSGLSQPLIARSGADHKEWINLSSFSEPAGVHVALGDLDRDGLADLVVGSARGSDPYIKIYGITQDPVLPNAFSSFLKLEIPVYDTSFRGGVRVATGDVNADGYPDIAFGPAAVPEPATIMSVMTGLGAWLLGGRRRKRDDAPPS